MYFLPVNTYKCFIYITPYWVFCEGTKDQTIKKKNIITGKKESVLGTDLSCRKINILRRDIDILPDFTYNLNRYYFCLILSILLFTYLILICLNILNFEINIWRSSLWQIYLTNSKPI